MKKKKILEDPDTAKKYMNKWVAITPDETRVVAAGDNPCEVLCESRKKGIKEPIVTRVSSGNVGYIL